MTIVTTIFLNIDNAVKFNLFISKVMDKIFEISC